MVVQFAVEWWYSLVWNIHHSLFYCSCAFACPSFYRSPNYLFLQTLLRTVIWRSQYPKVPSKNLLLSHSFETHDHNASRSHHSHRCNISPQLNHRKLKKPFHYSCPSPPTSALLLSTDTWNQISPQTNNALFYRD